MIQCRHHVCGFFAHREEAENALARLGRQGIPSERVQLPDANSTAAASEAEAGSTEVPTNVLVDGAIGTAVGTGIGALVGAATGAKADVRHKEGWLADLVRDAIASGQVVLVADTRNEQETAVAGQVIAAAVGESRDLSMA